MKKYFERIIEEAKKNGIDYVDNTQCNSNIEPMDSQTFVDKLNSEAMLSEEVFDKYEKDNNIDWEHIKQVIDVSETKYSDEYLKKNFNKSFDHIHDMLYEKKQQK